MGADPNQKSINKIDNCTFVKTILMLLVIVYHSCLFVSEGWFPVANKESTVLSYLADWLNSFHIYTFTLVSGYIYCYIRNEKKAYKNYKQFVIKKAKRLVVPAIIISVLWAAPICWLLFHYDVNELVRKFILAIAPNQLWFLWMLFWVFIICYPIIDKVPLWVSGVGSVFLYFIGNFGGYIMPNYFQIWTGCAYVIFFWLGYMLREKRELLLLDKIHPFVWLLMDILLFVVIQFLKGDFSVPIKALGFGLNFALCVVGSLMAFSVLQKIAGMVRWRDNKVFNLLSKRSMTIYLFHQQIIFLAIYLINARLPLFVQFVIYIVCGIIIPFFISSLLLRCRITRFMIGEKT